MRLLEGYFIILNVFDFCVYKRKSMLCFGNIWVIFVLFDDIFISYCYYLFLNVILSLCKVELILFDLILLFFKLVIYIYEYKFKFLVFIMYFEF